MRYFAPSKINLFFRVHRQREDRFHEIETVMQALSFGDHIEVGGRQGEDRFLDASSGRDLASDNLVVQAVDLFRHKTGLRSALQIVLDKQIPIGSGLGGGSSDLATTLWALNAHFGTNLPEVELQKWSASLSSDAPFFFSCGRAVVSGRGETVSPLFDRTEENQMPIYLAQPSHSRLLTSAVYNRWKRPLSQDPTHFLTLEHLLAHPYLRFNDLESAAFALLPNLRVMKQSLFELGFEHVLMSGSGTCFYCLGHIEEEPQLDGVDFYPAYYLLRDPGMWYQTGEAAVHATTATKELSFFEPI